MKRLASLTVLLIVLAFTVQTTVVAVFPALKAYLVATTGVAEEVVEEDESGEDDKVVMKSHQILDSAQDQVCHAELVMGTPRKLFREILAPPPQA